MSPPLTVPVTPLSPVTTPLTPAGSQEVHRTPSSSKKPAPATKPKSNAVLSLRVRPPTQRPALTGVDEETTTNACSVDVDSQTSVASSHHTTPVFSGSIFF